MRQEREELVEGLISFPKVSQFILLNVTFRSNSRHFLRRSLSILHLSPLSFLLSPMSLTFVSTARIIRRSCLLQQSCKPKARLSTTAPPPAPKSTFKPPQSSFLKARADAAEGAQRGPPPPPQSFLDQPAPPLSRVMFGLSLIGAAGAYGYLYTHLGGNESLARTASFYSLAIPSYIHYRYHMAVDSPDVVWDELHKETSLKGLNKILELQGFYVKSGQMAAANIGNAFPLIWQDTMSVLQDECPARSYEEVKQIVEEEYGKPLETIFSSFEEKPIGAASIGQVHRATLTSGEKVVVKIMYPNVENVFRGDVRTIKLFAQIAQPVHVPPLIEIEKQFMTEFDYVQEAKQLEKVRENMIKSGIAGGKGKCEIPKPYLDLCTKRVLVMDELKGDKLVVELKRDMERQKKRMEDMLKNEEKAEQFAKEFELGENGPTAEEYERLISLLNIRRRMQNVGAVLWNVSVGWLPGVEWKKYENQSSLPINHAKLIDDLLYVHGNQILVDGW
jgi:aarF domain-containing kinase